MLTLTLTNEATEVLILLQGRRKTIAGIIFHETGEPVGSPVDLLA